MRYVDKRFLSDCPDESGSMVCTVESITKEDMCRYYASEGHGRLTAEIQFRDCVGRPTVLDFSFSTGEKGFNKRLDKIDGMIQALQKFRAGFIDCYSDFQALAEYYRLNNQGEED